MVREALTLERLNALDAREAAALFVARRAEGLSSSEQALLADWLARGEGHQRAFDSADQAWRVFDGAGSDEILAAMRAHALAPRPSPWTRWRPALAAAVALLVVGGAVLSIPSVNPWNPKPEQAPQAIQYASAPGEVKAVTLPDGGVMTLDADSAAVGRFGARERSIQLQRGRAFFAVVPDATRPFTVTAAGQRIVAVGTRFDVALTPAGPTVVLLEGKVTVAPVDGSAPPVTLTPGQQFSLSAGAPVVRTLGAQAADASGWREGLITFDDRPLGDATAVMNRYSRGQIVIRDPAVAAMRVSGQFRAGDAERFADTLAELHGLRVVRRGEALELVPAG